MVEPIQNPYGNLYSSIKNLVLWTRSEPLSSADTGEDKI